MRGLPTKPKCLKCGANHIEQEPEPPYMKEHVCGTVVGFDGRTYQSSECKLREERNKAVKFASQLKAADAGIRNLLIKLGGIAKCVKAENTPEFMAYLEENIKLVEDYLASDTTGCEILDQLRQAEHVCKIAKVLCMEKSHPDKLPSTILWLDSAIFQWVKTIRIEVPVSVEGGDTAEEIQEKPTPDT